jgi:hypothetical protein
MLCGKIWLRGGLVVVAPGHATSHKENCRRAPQFLIIAQLTPLPHPRKFPTNCTIYPHPLPPIGSKRVNICLYKNINFAILY